MYVIGSHTTSELPKSRRVFPSLRKEHYTKVVGEQIGRERGREREMQYGVPYAYSSRESHFVCGGCIETLAFAVTIDRTSSCCVVEVRACFSYIHILAVYHTILLLLQTILQQTSTTDCCFSFPLFCVVLLSLRIYCCCCCFCCGDRSPVGKTRDNNIVSKFKARRLLHSAQTARTAQHSTCNSSSSSGVVCYY